MPPGTGAPKCDANKGPQSGNCPVGACLPPAAGCKLKKEFMQMGNACCLKPCNYVDASGNKCTFVSR